MAGLDQRQTWSRRVTRLFNGAGLDGDARLVNYFRWIRESRLQALYTPAFRARLGNAHAMAPMLAFLRPLSAQAEPLERMPALEQRFFLADHNLIYTDKRSMAVGAIGLFGLSGFFAIWSVWSIPSVSSIRSSGLFGL